MPEQQSVDITKISLVEVKALAFDIQNLIAFQTENLKLLRNELARRAQLPSESVVTQ